MMAETRSCLSKASMTACLTMGPASASGCGRTTCNIDNQWDIYGNILQEKNSFSDNGIPCGVGGAFQVFDVVFNGPVKFYNNTMVNINSSICRNNSVAGGIFVQQT